MTFREITKANRLLLDRISRSETIGRSRGLCLTVEWSDGSGQRIFYDLDEVYEHIVEHPEIGQDNEHTNP